MRECAMDCKHCTVCRNAVAARSVSYDFQADLQRSTVLVNRLSKLLEARLPVQCQSPTEHKDPDIVVNDTQGNLRCRVEAKHLQGPAFTQSESLFGIAPVDTLVIDESKLNHYIGCKARDREVTGRNIPLLVLWKVERPCQTYLAFQEIDTLAALRDSSNPNRRLTRAMGDETVCGVRTKFHYARTETKPPNQFIGTVRHAL
jgi:hypothetical protein